MQSTLSMTNTAVFLGKVQSRIRDDDDELSTAASGNTSGSGSESDTQTPKRLGKGQPTYHGAPKNAGSIFCLMGAVGCASRTSSPDKANSDTSTEAPSSPETSSCTPEPMSPVSAVSTPSATDPLEPLPAQVSKAKRSSKKSATTCEPAVSKAAVESTTAVLINAPWRRKAFAGLQGPSACPAPPSSLVQQKQQEEKPFLLSPPCGSLPAPPPGLFVSAPALPPGLTVPAGFRPPPGLELLTDVTAIVAPHAPAPPPGLAPVAPAPFDNAAFRKELVAILKDLDQNRSAVTAVQRLRACRVPVSRQAAEFADILTRAVEEPRGMVRRPILAFAVGLAAGQPSAFQRSECVAGVQIFFSEVYPDLCDEVPRLPKIASTELVPMLRSVFSGEELTPFLPEAMLDELLM